MTVLVFDRLSALNRPIVSHDRSLASLALQTLKGRIKPLER